MKTPPAHADLPTLLQFLIATGAKIHSPVAIDDVDGRLVVFIRVDPEATYAALCQAIPAALAMRELVSRWEGLEVPTGNRTRRDLAARKAAGASWADIAAQVNSEIRSCVVQLVEDETGAVLNAAGLGVLLRELGMTREAIVEMVTEAGERVERGEEPFEPDRPFTARAMRDLLRKRP